MWLYAKDLNMERILITVFLFTLLLFGCGGDMETFEPFSEDGEAPEILTGNVDLENMEDHAGVRIELLEINTSLVTDENGAFILPELLAEGEWTISSTYPFFSSAQQVFIVQNGLPSNKLETMKMEQQVAFNISTNKQEYMAGDVVEITLETINISDEPITLSSTSSPQVALAVRKDGVTVMGNLLPGDELTPCEITIDPEEPTITEISWTIDDLKFEHGEYEIFAILTDNVNYPFYFNPEENLGMEFNESLFQKLLPAIILIN